MSEQRNAGNQGQGQGQGETRLTLQSTLPVGVRVGFTATRTLRPAHHPRIVELLARAWGSEFTTGGAPGGDQLISDAVYQLHPNAHHRIVLPRLQASTRSHHAYADACASTHEIVHTQLPPLARNGVILDHCDRLIAFPLHEEHLGKRSGTWATVRRARARGIPVEIHVLDPVGRSLRAIVSSPLRPDEDFAPHPSAADIEAGHDRDEDWS